MFIFFTFLRRFSQIFSFSIFFRRFIFFLFSLYCKEIFSEISRPQRDLFVCVGSFFCVGKRFPHPEKVPIGMKISFIERKSL